MFTIDLVFFWWFLLDLPPIFGYYNSNGGFGFWYKFSTCEILEVWLWSQGLTWLSTVKVDLFLRFRLKAVIEPGSVILECSDTLHWGTLWMKYGWMKFGHLRLHLLIVHATWPPWECALGSWNALWVAYNMEDLVLVLEGVLNVSTWNVDFLSWLFSCGHLKEVVELGSGIP
jgi:hypothetical protein